SVVPVTETAAANGLNALMRSLGTTSAAAVLGVILASLTHQAGGLAVPTLGGYLTGRALTTGIALAASTGAPSNPRGSGGDQLGPPSAEHALAIDGLQRLERILARPRASDSSASAFASTLASITITAVVPLQL